MRPVRGRLRLGDFLAGWREGRRGLPVLVRADSGKVTMVPTGQLLSTWAGADARVHDVYRKLIARTGDARVELASIEPSRELLNGRIDDLGAQLRHALAAGPGTDRRMGEDNLPESLVVRRRAQEHDRRIGYLRRTISEARNSLQALDSREKQLHESVRVALDAARAQARLILADADCRVAGYLKGACRTHPDPQGLAGAPAELRRPEPRWLTAARPEDLIAINEEDSR
jgi:hypothetical protein